MLEAIDVGYRLIDTASLYFNEEAIGEAVEEAINKGKVKREELFITTKVWASHLAPGLYTPNKNYQFLKFRRCRGKFEGVAEETENNLRGFVSSAHACMLLGNSSLKMGSYGFKTRN